MDPNNNCQVSGSPTDSPISRLDTLKEKSVSTQRLQNGVSSPRLESPDSANGSSSFVLDEGRCSRLSGCGTKTTSALAAVASSSEDASEIDGEDSCRVEIRSQPNLVTADPRPATHILLETREPLKLKDFSEEVRGAMDVEQFVSQSELLLDVKESTIEGIVLSMLEKVVENEPKAKHTGEAEEIAREIFVAGSSMLMAQTIQGICEPTHKQADLEPDQSWLCALCQSARIRRRHMTIARFREPINLGVNAHEVRLLVLVLTPTETKGTKGPLETGRTFATMLASAEFRSRLMAARDTNEFKTAMVLEAQRMRTAVAESAGRSQVVAFKNRHKYMFDPMLHMTLAEYSRGQTRSADDKTRKSPPISFEANPSTDKLFELMSEARNRDDKNGWRPSGDELDEQPKVSGDASCCGSLWRQVEFGKGLWEDLSRRLRFYPSDFRDAFVGPPRTVQKTIATIWFLYFGILLPTIAFSSLNTTQTHGHMGDLRKAIIGQAIGGLGFALFGGQPLVIIMTTAPLCLYTKVIHQMCIDFGFHFPAMYAAVGIWNGVFLAIYSLFGFSKLMRWCTRSTEEIFALFIVIAFITDASKDTVKNFAKFYHSPACESPPVETSAALNATTGIPEEQMCRRETSLLFVLLMLGTLWLSTSLYKFKKTPYLSPGKRQLLADYALPTAVIIMSFVGSFVFSEIYVDKFPPLQEVHFERAQVELLPVSGLLVSLGLGFTLSLLFFMDQNISAAMVNAPQNRLKKGCAYHYDLLVVGVLNGFLASFGLPMMHGVLPHSPLHVLSLSDLEERLEEGHLRQVVTNCRENRVTTVVAHLLLLASLLLIPYPIAYIPRAVLNGLFLYMAVSSLDGLQIFERILLLFTEQNKYPPNHYIRRCPQRKIHKFTLIQLLQLLVMCLFGFSPVNIVEMFFPLIILLMIPFRHKIVPKYVGQKELEALDGKH